MKQVKLLSLELMNFKGIKHFKLDTNGSNTQVFGDNAAGKTTIFDGFVWVLFDKDSQNKKDFSIKTITVDGQEIHNLEHTVEAVLSVDGVPTKFKKVYKEKWTKKRGSANKTFEGHSTDHFVDDVPINKKEYTSKVAEIVEEEIFKLLTSPTYFNEQVKWQERRNILLNIAGDVSDQEVIEAKKDLAKLNDILSGKSIEDMKKIIASRKKNINDELEKIPVRIDEIMKMKPEITVDVEELKSQVAQLESEIDGLKTQKLNVQNGAAVLEKRKQLQEIETQMADLKRNYESESLEKVYKLQARVQECQGNMQIVQSKLQQAQSQKGMKESEYQRIQSDIQRHENWKQRLTNEWYEVDGQTFQHEDKCECPTCHQPLPVEQVEEARSKALSQFNENKSNKLAEITQQGLTVAAQIKHLKELLTKVQSEIEFCAKDIELLTLDVADKQKAFNKAKEQFEKAQNSVPDVTQTEEYQTLSTQLKVVKAEIDNLQNYALEAMDDIDVNIRELEGERSELNTQLSKFANIEANQKRVTELETQQQQLAEEYEKLEQQTFLIEEFIRTKVDMLNERINSKFKYARFKLFDVQVNGGLQETCETLYNGVPYGSGLNNAAKINVGLDIINTLSEFYGISAPIFIDNAEAVTKFIDTNSQLISLVVSEKDKQLRVEVEVADNYPTLNMEVV